MKRRQPPKKVWIIPRNFVIEDKTNPDIWQIVPNPYWEKWHKKKENTQEK